MARRKPSSKDKAPEPRSTESSGIESSSSATPNVALIRLHLRAGWSLLLAFVVLGIFLESLHGFKADLYLNVGNETRRFLWRLAHAHGTFLSLVNIAFAASLSIWTTASAGTVKLASACLLAATLLVPAGFFLGGFTIYSGDPSAGIVMLPIGALLLITALGLMAWVALKDGRRE